MRLIHQRNAAPGALAAPRSTTGELSELHATCAGLVQRFPKGESFVIAKAGHPMVMVSPLDAPVTPRRLGFLAGAFTVPDDCDRMGEDAIQQWFGRASPC